MDMTTEISGDASICRVCLEKGGAIPIFDTKGSSDPDVYSKLCQCIGEKIEDLDGYPRHICKLCHIALNTAIKLIIRFKESREIISKFHKQVVKQEIVENDEFSSLEQNSSDYINFPEVSSIKIEYEPVRHKDTDANNIKEEPIECTTKLLNTSKKAKKSTTDRKRLMRKVSNNRVKNKTKKQKGYDTNTEPEVPKSDTVPVEYEATDRNNKILKTEQIKFKAKPNTLKKAKTVSQTKPTDSQSKQKQDENNTNAHVCEDCGLRFPTHHKLYNHRETNHFPQAQCPQCTKTCSNQRHLITHIRTMHSSDEERKHVCSSCGKRFYYKNLLKRHIAIVHEKKKKQVVQCHLCDWKTPARPRLVLHIRSAHTGERPEVCTICQKAFYDKSTLNVHLRLHTGEKPYECLVCGKRFTVKGNLKSHIKHNHRVSQLDEECLIKLTKCRINYLKHMQP